MKKSLVLKIFLVFAFTLPVSWLEPAATKALSYSAEELSRAGELASEYAQDSLRRQEKNEQEEKTGVDETKGPLEKQKQQSVKPAAVDAAVDKQLQLNEAAYQKQQRKEELNRIAAEKEWRQQLKRQRAKEAKDEKRNKAAQEKATRKEERRLTQTGQDDRGENSALAKEAENIVAARAKAEKEWRDQQEKRAKEEALAKAKAEKEERLKRKALEKEERQQELAKAKAQKEWRSLQEKQAKQTRQEKAKAGKEESLARRSLEQQELKQAKVKEEAQRQWQLEQRRQEEEQARALRELEETERLKKLALEKTQKEQELARAKAEKERKLSEDKEKRKQQESLARIRDEAQKDALSRIKDAQYEELSRIKAEQQWRLEQVRIAREETENDLKIENEMKLRQLAQKKIDELRRSSEEREIKEREASLKKIKQEARKKDSPAADKPKVSLASSGSETAGQTYTADAEQAKIEKIEGLWREAKRLYNQGMYSDAVRYFQKVIELEGNPRIKYTPQAKELIERSRRVMAAKKRAELSREIETSEREMLNEVLRQQVPPYLEPPPHLEKVDNMPLVEPPLLRKKLREKKVTLDFDKVELKSVINFLFQESGINFVTSQKVQELAPKVSVRFKDASLDEVIKYITKSLGFIYRIDKDVVWLAHPDEIANEPLETRVYYLTKGAGLFTEFSPITSNSSETGLGGSSAQINKILTLEDTLKEIIPWPADSKIVYDKRINALIVRNTPQNLQTLEDMLYTLDVTPCQVLIEARFMEIDVTDLSELGLEWKLDADFPTKLKRRVTGDEYQQVFNKNSGLDFASLARAAEGFNLSYKGLLTQPQFEVVMHLLGESKKIKTLSSPRITTLSNQLATIKVVDEWIYPTRYEYEVVQTDKNGDGDFSDAGETTYKNVPKDFMRRDVGILLKVIPSVGADKRTINLALIPEVSEGTANGFTYTGEVTLPKFTSRNLSTTVVVNSGDTVVLGGMIKESRTKTTTKIPFLGDIPLLGHLFKQDSDTVQRKNLLIFVTAKLLTPAGQEVVVADTKER